MYHGGQPSWPWEPDLVDIDPRAEIAWFAKEYATELAELQSVLGSSPQLGWGLLAWVS
jgi:hypothetical protein